jgi:hypothetical protein
MKKFMLVIGFGLAAILHPCGSPHDHAANRIPSLMRQVAQASLGGVKELQIHVADSLDGWADEAAISI